MMRYLLLIPAVMLISCSDHETRVKQELTSGSPDTSISENTGAGPGEYKTARFLDSKESYYCYKNFVNPATFLEQTKIYLKPDSLSELIGSMEFNTPVMLTENNGKNCDWYEIRIGDKTGYIMAHQVATHTFNSAGKNRSLKYFIVTDFSDQQTNPGIESIIYKYDLDKKRAVARFEVKNFGANIIRQINTEKWKNVDLLLFFDNTNGCCGCTLEQHYLADANHKFETLFTTSTFLGDGGDSYEKWTSVTLPEDPEKDTIFYHEYEYGGLYDKKGQPVLDKKGNQKNGVISDSRKYYKWDGFKLQNINKNTIK